MPVAEEGINVNKASFASDCLLSLQDRSITEEKKSVKTNDILRKNIAKTVQSQMAENNKANYLI